MQNFIPSTFSFAGKKAILELMDAVDNTIPTPERDLDVPFYLPIESVHSIPGRLVAESTNSSSFPIFDYFFFFFQRHGHHR